MDLSRLVSVCRVGASLLAVVLVSQGNGFAQQLVSGDADQTGEFNQADLVAVQVAGKYLTGLSATWGEGDWDGAPGGSLGSPPPGDGLFNETDVVFSLQAGIYQTGPYLGSPGATVSRGGRLLSGGIAGDSQASVLYDAFTGEIAIDAPSFGDLTAIHLSSASGIFTGAAAANLGGLFDNDTDSAIMKGTFGSSFGSLSFGSVAQPGLGVDFVLNDLSANGALAGGGNLGPVDLIYVPVGYPAIKASIELAVGLSENGLPRIEKKICWSTIFNQTYQVQYSTNLGSTNWFDLGNAVIGDGGTNCVFDTTEDPGNRFYRVVNTLQ